MNNLAEVLLKTICERSSLQKKYIDKILPVLTNNELKDLNDIVNFFSIQGISIDSQVEAYLMNVSESLEETKYFMLNGTYRYSTLKEVATDVYYNKDYMNKYMIGLTLSGYIWSNHLEIMRWYNEKIKRFKGNKYLEIGPGYGQYFLKAMNVNNFKKYVAVDLSPVSVEGTKKFVDFFKKYNTLKYEVICQDFNEFCTSEKFDAIVMGEVLEHIERPDIILKKIFDVSSKEANIYITTVINAPAIDHIYLFNNVEEVFKLVESCGFIVEDYICTTGNNVSLEKAIKRKYAINIAMILKKARSEFETNG